MNASIAKCHTLTGLSGENPLAFLASLGVVTALNDTWPTVRMRWTFLDSWIPELLIEESVAATELVERLDGRLKATSASGVFQLGCEEGEAPADLTLSPGEFSSVCQRSAENCDWRDRALPDLCAALGTDADYGESTMADTALRTMSGAGHQHFLGSIRHIAETCEAVHVEKTLFGMWRYDDPVERLTMRWDPVDDVRYALRSRNPSGDPARRRVGSVLGANRLAVEALPLLPTAPGPRSVRTTGFRGRTTRDTFLCWPIWTAPIGLHSIRSLLNLEELVADHPNRDMLVNMGVAAVYRSQRITVGKLRNFTKARCVA